MLRFRIPCKFTVDSHTAVHKNINSFSPALFSGKVISKVNGLNIHPNYEFLPLDVLNNE